MKFVSGVLCIAAAVIILVTVAIRSIEFNRNCGGHLERAASASSVDIAVKELTTAITYLEDNGMTEGYTSVLYTTPGEDVGFFYRNLVSARTELMTLPAGSTQLEKTNTLMKLRETLIYQAGGEAGEKLDMPSGMSRFPHNGTFALLFVLVPVLLIAGVILIGLEFS